VSPPTTAKLRPPDTLERFPGRWADLIVEAAGVRRTYPLSFDQVAKLMLDFQGFLLTDRERERLGELELEWLSEREKELP
jgi:hypothetical protein